MQISTQVIELIKHFEGFRSKVYLCPTGYKTIGYGHVLLEKDKFQEVNSIEAEELLIQDLNKAAISVINNISIMLTQGQFDALVSFTFNLGGAALQRSVLRQKINRQEHQEVAKEFMRWVYAGGVILAGLVKRRALEVEMYTH